MKIAVCFSGHMRTFALTLDSFRRHIADKYDTRVFIHSWDTTSAGRETSSTCVDRSAIIGAYHPHDMIIEPQRQFVLNDHPLYKTARGSPHNVYSKSFSTQQSINLALKHQQIEKFDVIVSMRADMLLHDDVIINDRRKMLFVPGNVGGPYGTIHDYFAFGDPSIMETYSQLYDHFDKIVRQLNVATFRAEHVMAHYVLMRKMPIGYCNVDYSLVRMSGELQRMTGFAPHEQLGQVYNF